MINKFTQFDLTHLKKISKPTPSYEFFSIPLLFLFNKLPQRIKKANGTIENKNWPVLQKEFQNSFLSSLKNFGVELISQENFMKLDTFLSEHKEEFSVQIAS